MKYALSRRRVEELLSLTENLLRFSLVVCLHTLMKLLDAGADFAADRLVFHSSSLTLRMSLCA